MTTGGPFTSDPNPPHHSGLNRRRVLAMSLVGVLGIPLRAETLQAGRVHRIGFLRVGQPPQLWLDSFLDGLRERNYVEGRHFAIEYGLARNAAELPDIAADLVRRKVDVLVASGTPSVVPAKEATRTIPIVFVAAVDPVAAGVTASLARPGANVTGITAMHADLIAKRLGLLKELLPRVATVAVLARVGSAATAQYVKEAEAAAPKLRLHVRVVTLRDVADLDAALTTLQPVHALVVADDAVFTAHRDKIVELALKHRLPAAYGFSEMVEAGGLMAYGPHYGDMYRRAAIQVDKILRGAKPAELPVEQPVRFELAINLKTARALGLTIPPSVLARADQILE
jgi:putative tryptophan/tyrosine transport system substrate-binding protein